jgi:DNA-binding Lrp family transcriptional regulator
MSDALGPVLFQSQTRSAVLELLFVRGLSASVSELARRTGLSPRAVSNEVRHLLPTGLLIVETVGGADVVRGNLKHTVARHLRALFAAPGAAVPTETRLRRDRESLAGWGAPLAGVRPLRHLNLHETLLRGLELAHHDGTVLRVLPTVLARNEAAVDWAGLREDARRRKLKAELGWLIELTSELLERPTLTTEASGLHDKRRRSFRFFPETKSTYEAELAKRRAPEVALRWGFWMNMSTDSFRSVLDKHHA